MSNWQKIMESKLVLAEIRKELNALKKQAPSEENAREIVRLEKRVAEVTRCIQTQKRSYGFVA